MYSFLPLEYRVKVQKEYRARVFMSVFGLSAVLALCLVILAVPSYTVLLARKSTLVTAQNSKVDDALTTRLESELHILKEKVDILENMKEEKSLGAVVHRITARLIPGISLSGMSIKRSAQGGSVSLAGIAGTRDALVAFSKSLQGEPSFMNVVLPVSTLAKNKNIDFSITIDVRI